MINDYLWLIPAFPLAGVLINAFFGHLMPKKLSGTIACLAVLGSLVVSVMGLMQLLGMPGEERFIHQTLFTWISTGIFHTSVALMLDPLSAVMVCVVSGVGFLIHVYSTGYMSHDPRYHRFFVYMNLFTFAMLVLVLADNFLLMFVGWEGVGLCSYLLIGFWFGKKSAADAGKKAFLVNRVGDFGFLLGMMMIFATFGTLTFQPLFAQVAQIPGEMTLTLTIICLLLFVGATGKSAQIPLFVWLPDAMEGPTPVSALIHAATMVTAGVYMVARCGILFANAPVALLVVAIIGALTAFFAATIGLVQNDSKRVLAYSTVSQLGYMFMACGVGAYAAGVFHLVTHAFFKALLFLGAGSVMHATGNETDIRKMGGLKRWMPITTWTFWAGTLAIAGIPFFSGFFSKDEILWYSIGGPMGSWFFYGIGLATAGLTAFYMARLTFKIFHGEPRMPEEVKDHVHESPPSMSLVLVLLAVGAVFAGFLNVPAVFGEKGGVPEQYLGAFGNFLQSPNAESLGGHIAVLNTEQTLEIVRESARSTNVGFVQLHEHLLHDANLELTLMGVTILLAVVAIWGFGRAWYLAKPGTGTSMARKIPALHGLLLNKYYVDEFYQAAIIRPGMAFSHFLWRGVDVIVIDGIVNAVAWIVGIFSRLFRVAQSGYVRSYAAGMLAGVIIVIWVLMR